jgi:anti-sigma B factor antagonist
MRSDYNNRMAGEEGVELLRWSVSRISDEVIVALVGEMDLSNARTLSEAIGELLDARPAQVTLDLTDLSFLDSSGIRCLVNTAKRATEVGCDLAIRNAARPVARVMELTGVVELLLDRSNGATAETH